MNHLRGNHAKPWETAAFMESNASRKHLLLRPEDVPASHVDFDVVGVFNPGAVDVDGEVLLLVRVAEQPRERRPEWIGLPRWLDGNVVVDWVREADVEYVDPRVVRIKATGLVRLTFLSHLRLVRCGDGFSVGTIDPVDAGGLIPRHEWEEYGVEDPRITKIGDRYWITYVAVSRHGAATALASTDDFRGYERHGIIFPPENKDVVLFPDSVGGRYAALHRPNGATPFTTPEMWVAFSEDLLHWGGHEPLYAGHGQWESGRVGAGAPPIRVADGWLEIYHGNRRPKRPGDVGRYEAAALLLDLQRPAHVLRQSNQPFLTPTEPFECAGFVPDVVFPTGIVRRGDSMLIYYGASDTNTGVVSVSLDEILSRMSPL